MKYQALTLLLLILAGAALVLNACTGGPTYGPGSPFVPLPASPTIPGTVVAVATSTKTHTPVPTSTHTPIVVTTPTFTPTGCVVAGGNTGSVGATAASGSVLNDPGTYISGPYTITASAAVTGLEVFLTAAPGADVHMGIYKDNGSGTLPTKVVYESPLITIATGGSYVYNLSAAPVTVCPGAYWTAFASADTSTGIDVTEADTAFTTTYWTVSSVFPDPFPSAPNTGFGPVMQILYQY